MLTLAAVACGPVSGGALHHARPSVSVSGFVFDFVDDHVAAVPAAILTGFAIQCRVEGDLAAVGA